MTAARRGCHLLRLLTAGYGTKRRFVATPKFGRDRSKADIPEASIPDAFALLMVLRRCHNCRKEFAVGKAMSSKLGWSLPRFRAVRARLEEDRYIICLLPGGRGKHDPPRYALRGTIPCTNHN
jgi:hypothetical protein